MHIDAHQSSASLHGLQHAWQAPASRSAERSEDLLCSGMKQAEDEIHPSEIAICKRPDGSDWCLGEGNFGKVRHDGLTYRSLAVHNHVDLM